MNNPGEVQTVISAPQDVAPVVKAMSLPATPLDIPLEQLGLMPFDPDVWDLWAD